MRFGVAVALGLPVAVVVACHDAPTRLSLTVTSDVPCAELRGVRIRAVGPAGDRTLETQQCAEEQGATRVGVATVVPGGSDDANVAVEVVAGVGKSVAACTRDDGFAGCIVARRELRFVPHRDVAVAVALRRACAGALCDGRSTCVAGACRPAALDATACLDAPCDEAALGAPTGGPASPSPTPVLDAAPSIDAGVDLGADAAPIGCGPAEKVCGGACVSHSDPRFGCSTGGCTPCPGLALGNFVCALEECSLVTCKSGFKRCGSGCVPVDAASGCGAPSCAPCDATNGQASCTTGSGPSACALTCKSGFKLCGGRCVDVKDPTYGCTATGCSAAACPNPSGGTLACVGSTCVIGACPAGTKKCNQKCVPTDAQNGCQDPQRCTPCASSEACSGAPAVCTCVPEPLATTCAGKACGPMTNNCGQTVTCPNTCQAPDTCGGGSGGPNACGCSDPSPCGGRDCGNVRDACGRRQSCGSCAWPDYCGGGGTSRCGAPVEGDCGDGWPTMGSFGCDAGRRTQTICGCHPPHYADTAYWLFDGSCYFHFTGEPC